MVNMTRKYHNHKLQINLWHHEEEPYTNQTNKAKQPALSFPKLEWAQSNKWQNIEQLQNHVMGVKWLSGVNPDHSNNNDIKCMYGETFTAYVKQVTSKTGDFWPKGHN